MELVFFSIMGDCVCKIVCQFFLLLGLSVSWLVFICIGFFEGSWGLCLVLGLSVCGLVSM